ncbi:hypothetical protein ASE95_03060 [Sphingomonas sp. Leaf231]|uniref:hypothetical protein n=1 Tax=Sphingomonas sp. Leaf231 TaxID=1736301 RepID=UPI0006F5F831|nr:hypothetical protein [Sphingomonas sp. Leaf231]KQN93895.1 hypothetical protein ASE95_03060 [Sphingomonas sp. Leaf231]
MTLSLALAMQVAAQPAQPRREVKQADLNAMADACHAPRKWLYLKGREVVFAASPDADYDTVACVLGKVSAAGSITNVSFIGNEQASKEK